MGAPSCNIQDGNLKQLIDEYIPLSKEVDLHEMRKSAKLGLKKFPDAVYFGDC